MKFFVDTADIKEIEELIPTGFVNGVTTNPSLIAKNGDDMAKSIKAICAIVPGPVSAEVTIASAAADTYTYFQVVRNAAAGGDTFTGDVRLLGIKLFYTTDAANDA